MKALFNCSVIKNVYLHNDAREIELEITYLDELDKHWVYRKKIAVLANTDYNRNFHMFGGVSNG